MKNLKRIGLNVLAVTAIGLLISGCSTSYSLIPQYDKDKKSVVIGDLKFDDVTYYSKKIQKSNSRSLGNIKKYREEFNLKNSTCNRLTAHVSDASNRWYFSTKTIDDIKRHYNDKCDTETIANLEFSVCTSQKTTTTDKGKEHTKDTFTYLVSSSTPNEFGYGNKTSINLDTKKCFTQTKGHFKKSLALNK